MVVTMVNTDIVKQKIKDRQNRIDTYAETNKVPKLSAAIFVDQNAPYTTNQNMLREVGFNVDQVTEDNYLEVLEALRAIGVIVCTNDNKPSKIARVLNTIITEEIPECWGGPDVQEFIDISCDEFLENSKV